MKSNSMTRPKTEEERKQYKKRLLEIEELKKQGIYIDYS